MLDREEEQRLAEIEAQLRVEDPELHGLFDRAPAMRPSRPGPPQHRPHPDRLDPRIDRAPDDRVDQPDDDQPREATRHDPLDHPGRRWDDGDELDGDVASRPGVVRSIVRTFVAVIAAIAVTTIVTLVLGPNVGGFVSVVAFCLAGMYGYQTIRGCPGLRRARGQG